MMDSGHLNKSSIEFHAQPVNNENVQLQGNNLQEENVQNLLQEENVQNLQENGVNENAQAPGDNPEAVQVDVQRPVPHVPRKMHKALDKVFNWNNLKATTSRPVHDAIGRLYEAETEDEFAQALKTVIETSLNYMTINKGNRSRFGSGNERKSDIRAMLNEIVSFSVQGGSKVTAAIGDTLSSEAVQGREYHREISEAFRNTLNRKYHFDEYQDIAGMMEQNEQTMVNDLSNWGGLDERARQILEQRRANEAAPEGQERVAYNFDADKLQQTVDALNIPDTKTLNDYQLLSYPGLEETRKNIYEPLSQNLDYLILTGRITDLNTIGKLRARLDTLKDQLDAYDARLTLLSGAEDSEELRRKADVGYAADLQQSKEDNLAMELVASQETEEYKRYYSLINPGRKLPLPQLTARRLVIEQNRARRSYLLNAKKISQNKSIEISQAQSASEALTYYRQKCDAVFGTDLSELLDQQLTQEGILKNLGRKLGNISMLSSLDQVLADINAKESELSEKEKKNLKEQGLLLSDQEKGELQTLYRVGRLLKDYTDKMISMAETDQGSRILSESDYESITDEETRRRLLTAPEAGVAGFEDKQRLYETMRAYSELDELKLRIDDELQLRTDAAKRLRPENAQARNELTAQIRERIDEENRVKELIRSREGDFKDVSVSKDKSKDLESRPDDRKEMPDAEQFFEKQKKERLDALLKKGIEEVVESYNALSEKDATVEDARKIRVKVVDTISKLSGLKASVFNFIPTKVLADALSDVKSKKHFDQNAYSKEIADLVGKLEDEYEDNSTLKKTISELNEKKELTAIQEQMLREYSTIAFFKNIEMENRNNDALKSLDTRAMARYAMAIMDIYDIDYEDELTKEQQDKLTKTCSLVLSEYTGRQIGDFSWIPAKELADIMYHSMSHIGNLDDVPAYIAERVETEKRKKIITDGKDAFSKIDRQKAKKSTLSKARADIVKALALLTETDPSELELLPTLRLFAILTDAEKDVADKELFNKNLSENLQKLDKDLLPENLDEYIAPITTDTVSEDYKEYLTKEYAANAYAKLFFALKLGDREKFTGKDFENVSAYDLSFAAIHANALLQNAPEPDDNEKMENFRGAALGMLSKHTARKVEELQHIPTYYLEKMARELLSAANDKSKVKKVSAKILADYEAEYEKDKLTQTLSELMGRKDKISIDYMKQISLHFLFDIRGLKDIGTREEVQKLPGMTIYTMVLGELSNAEKMGNKSRALDALKVGKIMETDDSFIMPMKQVVPEKEPESFSEEATGVLTLIGDLVSGEKLYDRKGKELTGRARILAILDKHADTLAILLDARTDKKLKKAPMAELDKGLRGGEKKLIESVSDSFLNELMRELDGLRTKGLKQEEAAPEWNADLVKKLLMDKSVAGSLDGAEASLSKAITENDGFINQLISDASDEIFGWLMDQQFYPVTDDEPKEAQKSKEQAGLEKLRRLRDEVFGQDKGQGKFLRLVIKDYYKMASPQQRLSMMSYLIKDLKPSKKSSKKGEKGAELFASLLKGAGPIMQKLFQGIPEHMLMKQFLPALSVVKSNLRDIPGEYVDTQMERIKQDANRLYAKKGAKRRIESIRQLQSLGAASIAQTFLCEVNYMTEYGKHTEQVVIKIRRPDVNIKTLESERRFIEQCAKKTDDTGVMLSTFNAHYKKILEELDFSREKENALMGMKVYNEKDAYNPKKPEKLLREVHSVNISSNIPSSDDYLIMDKAEGVTADKYIQQLKEFADERLSEFQNYNPDTHQYYSSKYAQTRDRFRVRKEIADKLIEAQKCQRQVAKLVETWIQKALFTQVDKNGYFHHGDLHAGNIMVNKDYATVLDYGNCTVIDKDLGFFQRGRIPSIVKMMAAAFAGYSDDFITNMEALIEKDQNNDYNKLSSGDKKVIKAKLKKNLDEVFSLGDGKNTGERIFVALLKAQEQGIKLPQEILNFSQCQQRLENSLDEINNAVEELRRALYTVDSMGVTDFNVTRLENIEPVNALLHRLGSEVLNSDDAKEKVEEAYASVEILSKAEVMKKISTEDGRAEFEEITLSPFMQVRDDVEERKADYQKILNRLKTWKADFKEYVKYRNMDKKSVTDQEDLQKIGKYDGMFNDMLIFSSTVQLNHQVLGAFFDQNYFASVCVMACANFSETCLDEIIDFFVKKLPKICEVADKYDSLEEAGEDEIAKEEFVEIFDAFKNENLIDSGLLSKIKEKISPDMMEVNYIAQRKEEQLITQIDAEINKPTRDMFKKDENGNYIFGEHAQRLYSCYEQLKKYNGKPAHPSDEKRKELTEETAFLYNTFVIRDSMASWNKELEKQLEDYFKEDSELGRKLGTAYKERLLVQKKYFEMRLARAKKEELDTAWQERVRAEKEFLQTLGQMANQRLKFIYDAYRDYRPTNMANFVTIMADRIKNNSGTVLSIFKSSIFKYKDAFLS